MNRRNVLKGAVAAGVASLARPGLAPAQVPGGRLKQGVSLWCWQKWYTLDQLCQEAARIGIKGIDLVTPDQYATVQKYGLIPSMTAASEPNTIPIGLNRIENHDRVLAKLKEDITAAAAAKVPNVITFSGNRRGMPDEEGLKNCAIALNKIKGYAEEKGVTVNLELLNSKVDHHDYMADHSAWGIELMKQVNSPRVKLLYDIYHMQIMEGDLIRTITKNIQYFGHFHTGGNPGRHELDDTQEVTWHAVAKAIADTGYEGFISHEFVPAQQPVIRGLEQAYELCNV
ncbi:MAG TPA: sugar phosphate isomerase/epimerase family protein [Bryobacteraceae bacterium]|jgi:hydroxypyruvate isomerase|nr:sugar phosphate isomerase/epimerase family protein [Bryobacteraceae bacterium]